MQNTNKTYNRWHICLDCTHKDDSFLYEKSDSQHQSLPWFRKHEATTAYYTMMESYPALLVSSRFSVTWAAAQ